MITQKSEDEEGFKKDFLESLLSIFKIYLTSEFYSMPLNLELSKEVANIDKSIQANDIELTRNLLRSSKYQFGPLILAHASKHIKHNVCEFLIGKCEISPTNYSIDTITDFIKILSFIRPHYIERTLGDYFFSPEYGEYHQVGPTEVFNNSDIIDSFNAEASAILNSFIQNNIEQTRHLLENGIHLNAAKILFEASEDGKLDLCKFLIEKCNVSPNIQNKDGHTPLFISAINGHMDICRFLVKERNADLDGLKKFLDGDILLPRSSREYISIYRFLVKECGVDYNKFSRQEEIFHKMLTISCHSEQYTEFLRFLVKECKVNLYSKDKNGNSHIAISIINGSVPSCKFLIKECGFDPNMTADLNHKSKMTAPLLMLATKEAKIDICRFLVYECGVNPDITDQNESTAVHYCYNFDSLNFLVEELGLNVNAKNIYGQVAYDYGLRPTLVRNALIEYGSQTLNGSTTLSIIHTAANNWVEKAIANEPFYGDFENNEDREVYEIISVIIKSKLVQNGLENIESFKTHHADSEIISSILTDSFKYEVAQIIARFLPVKLYYWMLNNSVYEHDIKCLPTELQDDVAKGFIKICKSGNITSYTTAKEFAKSEKIPEYLREKILTEIDNSENFYKFLETAILYDIDPDTNSGAPDFIKADAFAREPRVLRGSLTSNADSEMGSIYCVPSEQLEHIKDHITQIFNSRQDMILGKDAIKALNEMLYAIDNPTNSEYTELMIYYTTTGQDEHAKLAGDILNDI